MKYNIHIPEHSDFTIWNFPFGIGIIGGEKRVVSRLGDTIIDLAALHSSGLLINSAEVESTLQNDFLNDFIRLGKSTTNAIRNRLIEIFTSVEGDHTEIVRNNVLHAANTVPMSLPVNAGDYTDFYSSKEHAFNVGVLFRGAENALQPNWLHLPVGYHGRSSSIVVSGTDLAWPYGQILDRAKGIPEFGPCQKMDYELEMAFVIGKDSTLGCPVKAEEAEDYIFGFALFNDWSARDIQAWEYVPLGPFLGKNFGSTISPWIITLEALEPFRTESPVQVPEILEYLKTPGEKTFDIQISVSIQPSDETETSIATSNFKYLYWNPSQQIAHHTVNGCNLRVGDIMASGTISGENPGQLGSLLELSHNGKETIELEGGVVRTFLKSGDTVRLTGHCHKEGVSLGFGVAEGKVVNEKL